MEKPLTQKEIDELMTGFATALSELLCERNGFETVTVTVDVNAKGKKKNLPR